MNSWINRRQGKIVKLNNSLVTVLPHEYHQALKLQKGESLVQYHLGEILVIVPLRYLTKWGEPKIVECLQKSLTKTAR